MGRVVKCSAVVSCAARWSGYVGECGQGEKTDPDAENVQESAALIEIEKEAGKTNFHCANPTSDRLGKYGGIYA